MNNEKIVKENLKSSNYLPLIVSFGILSFVSFILIFAGANSQYGLLYIIGMVFTTVSIFIIIFITYLLINSYWFKAMEIFTKLDEKDVKKSNDKLKKNTKKVVDDIEITKSSNIWKDRSILKLSDRDIFEKRHKYMFNAMIYLSILLFTSMFFAWMPLSWLMIVGIIFFFLGSIVLGFITYYSVTLHKQVIKDKDNISD